MEPVGMLRLGPASKGEETPDLMNPGRNDPCHCGSGKKYKKCCLMVADARQVADFAYQKFRDTEKKVITRLLEHTDALVGPAGIDRAWADFHFKSAPEPMDPGSLMMQIFGPYLLYSWEIDTVDNRCDPSLHGKTLAEAFLQAPTVRLNTGEVEIITAANRPAYSFFEITGVTPGHSMSMRNIFTGQEHDLMDRSASLDANRGDILFCALMSVGGKWQTLATGPYRLPPLYMQKLIQVRMDLQKEYGVENLSHDELRTSAKHLRELYLSFVEQVANPVMPTLQNTDGDPLEPQTLHFEIRCPDDTLSKLAHLASDAETEAELREKARMKRGKVDHARIPWLRRSKGSRRQPPTILGNVVISGTKLTVDVNSEKRAATIRQEIDAALGADAKFVRKVIHNPAKAAGSKGPKANGRSHSLSPDQLTPAHLEVVKNFAVDHWQNWFDEEIPALDGKTPRQAAKSTVGRELLEALLNSYARDYAGRKDPIAEIMAPDLKAIRLELGLPLPDDDK